MVIASTDIALFPFIESGHPFHPHIARFREAISAERRCTDLLGRAAGHGRTLVHAEIKGRPDGQGWALDRFYWSLQAWGAAGAPPAPSDFAALTLVYAATDDRLTWHTFPSDPYLTTMAASVAPYDERSLDQHGVAPDILRYVPLRRLTFHLNDPDGVRRALVGKVKRPSRCAEAYRTLTTVARAVDRSAASFDVAAPRGFDAARCLYFQSALPGDDLAALLAPESAPALLYRVGALHRELHDLDVTGVPIWDRGPFLADLRRDIRWIIWFRPDYAALLLGIEDLLLERAPRMRPHEYCFCHGDFVCSQMLVAGDRWAVTDFDLAHRGDRYRDIATLLTSLAYDVPVFQGQQAAVLEGACDAYLRGYEDRAGQSLDQGRLLWYRLCAEISYLALVFKKDWFQPAICERSFARLRELCTQMRGG